MYAVGADLDGHLYAATRPTLSYVARPANEGGLAGELTWRELDGFQELLSRDERQLLRHENLAQIPDIRVRDRPSPSVTVAVVQLGLRTALSRPFPEIPR